MEERGHDTNGLSPVGLDSSEEALSRYFVIVGLQDQSRSRIDAVPFHTSVLEWDLGDAPDSVEGIEEMYREIATHVQDLVEILSGEESD